jgi:hypothetical protein
MGNSYTSLKARLILEESDEFSEIHKQQLEKSRNDNTQNHINFIKECIIDKSLKNLSSVNIKCGNINSDQFHKFLKENNVKYRKNNE